MKKIGKLINLSFFENKKNDWDRNLSSNKNIDFSPKFVIYNI